VKPNDADGKVGRKALLLVSHEPTQDPRIDWFSEGLAADFEVCEIGIYRRDVATIAPSFERLSPRRARVRIDGHRVRWDFVAPWRRPHDKASLGLSTMERLFLISQLPARSLDRVIGAGAEEDLTNFLWRCDYFVKVNSSLMQASRRIGAFDVIVAADLETLPAAVALGEEYGVPIVYDAHEYWPHAFAEFSRSEIAFWSDLEKILLERVTLPLTVSPQLAAVMSKDYGYAFDCIPNCASLGSERAVDLEAALAAQAQRTDVIFLVQGIFGLQRGFEKLINIWNRVDPQAKLWLRGPDSPEKTAIVELAKSKGLLDRGVFFPTPVGETELVAAARDADVGLVPYEPTSLNNRYCSPNKLSQYLAAGLPIICNELDFVKSVVVENGVGAAVDFRDEAALIRTINGYVRRRDSIPALSRMAQALFKTSFNWQVRSQRTYAAINKLVSTRELNTAEFDFVWINDVVAVRSSADLSAQETLVTRIEALNKVYTDEIARLNTVHTKEIKRLLKRPFLAPIYVALRRVAYPLMVGAKSWIRPPS
jgi:glycosyltransferase involved in cell wall biosynthesis